MYIFNAMLPFRHQYFIILDTKSILKQEVLKSVIINSIYIFYRVTCISFKSGTFKKFTNFDVFEQCLKVVV